MLYMSHVPPPLSQGLHAGPDGVPYCALAACRPGSAAAAASRRHTPVAVGALRCAVALWAAAVTVSGVI